MSTPSPLVTLELRGSATLGPGLAAACLEGIAPSGRRMLVGSPEESAYTAARPVILSEFGGVSVDPTGNGTWGYQHVESPGHLEQHLVSLFAAVRDSEGLAGWCYTQLTDTAQETNGLADADRVPKLPMERIRALVEGRESLPARETVG